ncbi:MAG: hypothetical protein FWC43_14280 [Planctomycetaceae bacterium]|nr:hypothetical protein [Planctomycetaceae bacterium]
MRLLPIFIVVFSAASCFAASEPGQATVEINGKAVFPTNGTAAGIWFFYDPQLGDASPQLLLMGFPLPTPEYRINAVLNPGDRIVIRPGDPSQEPLVYEAKNRPLPVSEITNTSLDPLRRPWSLGPTECSPNLKPELEAALLEHDWRMQDGIDTPRESRTYKQVIKKMIPQMESLFKDLSDSGAVVGDLRDRFESLKNMKNSVAPILQWYGLHQLRRELVLRNPLFPTGPLVFAKHVPSAMSHQLTQTYGYTARPGGGLFVLDKPGVSMQVRSLTDGLLPMGSYAHPALSYDGKKIYFAFCEADRSPEVWRDPNTMSRRYHLYEMNSDGTGPKQLTDGDYDDFNPTPLPDGDLIFISTRRGGFHRCGGGPCYVYTLSRLNRETLETRVISFHETNEWDPALMNDGRVLYTRWDYVDRDAVFYQQLWVTRQDGTNVRAYYGNNTFVPCGIWESRAIPGSGKVMAVAGPHHGMSAGSIILLDTTRGVDGPEPIERLTPDARFPESEYPLAAGVALPSPSDFDSPVPFYWNAVNRPDRPGFREANVPEQESRWPGHCYKAPWPLSEKYFLVSYSYDQLRGEAGPNLPNMFGIYFVDVYGNKELLYRDPNISSVWAKPLAGRPAPPTLQAGLEPDDVQKTGTFYMQNVNESWPPLPDGATDRIRSLRIVQVLPKTTPNANDPMVGAAYASPGKQVLGTIPVEEDGSAYFECPAEIPILFQALDAEGRAVQTMRSLTYLQPGENMSCVGCHENRMQTFTPNVGALAMQRAPSKIKPGPDGGKPLSFPILVQPVLERHCVECHSEKVPEQNGGIILTGEPDGRYTKSYNALISRVTYTAWSMPEGNHEPMTQPGRFGARASTLTKLLQDGHYNVQLTGDEWERLNTWMDANALFYGTFNRTDQARQLRGERIEGPELE